jgi:hypothetical protein
MRKGPSLAAAVLLVVLGLAPAIAQDGKFSKQQLDQMLAPIALYPDDLLTNVLMASTYPLDVVQAARWRKEPENTRLKGDALANALAPKDWDPSVKALVQFPQVLDTMSDKLDWTQKLGDAFLSQQDEVMDEIQVLRAKADDAGNLKSNKQQTVTKQSDNVIVIEPATPDVVYVPEYQPSVVYGSWWYPDYPPYYWPYPGAAFVNGFFWGAGIAVAGGIWGWNHFDWHNHNIDIDVNRWNNINVRGAKITSHNWRHDPAHRGPVPYRDKATREKFGQTARPRDGNKDFRGYDRDAVDRSKIESRLKDTDHAGLKDKGGREAKDQIRERADGAGKTKLNDGQRRPDANRQLDRKPSPAAFDVKRGADVRQFSDRGHASRASANRASAPHGSGGQRGGGGHRGGGRRR